MAVEAFLISVRIAAVRKKALTILASLIYFPVGMVLFRSPFRLLRYFLASILLNLAGLAPVRVFIAVEACLRTD
jgi:hypothetical protein